MILKLKTQISIDQTTTILRFRLPNDHAPLASLKTDPTMTNLPPIAPTLTAQMLQTLLTTNPVIQSLPLNAPSPITPTLTALTMSTPFPSDPTSTKLSPIAPSSITPELPIALSPPPLPIVLPSLTALEPISLLFSVPPCQHTNRACSADRRRQQRVAIYR